MMGRRSIRSCFLFITLFAAVTVRAGQSLSYETLGDLRMKALGLSMASENKSEDIKDIKQALHISIPEDQKRRMVYQLCAQSEKRQGIDSSSDDQALKIVFADLDVLGSLLDRINNVQTYRGEAALVKMLGTPLACDTEQSRNQWANRKAFIQQLVDDPELLAQCDQLLAQLARNQDNILSYWTPEAPLTKELIGKIYFGKATPAYCNKSSAMLEAGVRFGNLWTGFSLCGDIALLGLMNYALGALAHKSDKTIPAPSVKDALVSGVQFYNPYNAIKALWNLDSPDMVVAREQAAMNAQMSTEALRRVQSITLKVSAVFQSALLGYKAVSCKRAIDHALQVRDTANYLQERLIGVGSYVRAVHALIDLSQLYPELAKGLHTFSAGVSLFEQKNDELHQLINLLMTNTFTGHASFFSRTGRVLAAHSLMQSVKDELFDRLACLGELDACVSIAHLYKQYEHEHVRYSFAEFCAQDEPYICAIDFWNPLVNPAVAVTNNVELGHPCAAHHMILTGSNKGGKSTLLKAMMIAKLCSQTIIISPCKRLITTPCTSLMTYLNVTDNTAEGQSLFAAQVARAKKIVNSVDALKKGDRAFIVIDEIFTGTGSANAAKAATKVVNHLAASPHACFIIATHFVDSLPLLEKSTKGRCKNFKFDADKDEQGNLQFRYKLEEGISTTNIANEILGQELNEIDFSSELGDL